MSVAVHEGKKSVGSLTPRSGSVAPRNLQRNKRTSETVPAIVHDVLHSSGDALDSNTRTVVKSRFGHSFEAVRIHTDGHASTASASLGAAAFTFGNHIVFGANRYAPSSLQGQLLMHHELRHVAQQRMAAPVSVLEMDPPNSMYERDARRIFDTHVEPLPKQRIQCAPEDAQFSIGDGLADKAGRQVFGETAWPFIRAVFEGFIGGLQSDVKAGRADTAKNHLYKLLVPWNAAKFYVGYLVGLIIGLVSPITDLVKGIIGVVKLSISALEWLAKWSAIGIAVSPARQQKIALLMQKFAELSIEFGKSLSDFVADPRGAMRKFAGFLDDLMKMALGKARELGAKASHSIFDYLEKDYYDMGQGIGEVIGMLIAQVLLLVFSDAIGNLISKGASFLGKAAEFVAGKAVEVFNWVKSFASEVMSTLRNATKGALKLFEGLMNKAVEAFDALVAIFTESESLEAAGEKVAAGAGKGIPGPKTSNVMESRMVKATRETKTKTAELYPPKVHPSNVGKELPKRPELGKAPFDEPLRKGEKKLTRDELRQKHILEEFSERQRGARGATKQESATGMGRKEVRTPGKSIPPSLERGQFAHEYAELLIDESELPHGLTAEVTADLPGGRVRIDRVDFEKGVYYEIKPNTLGAQRAGSAQIAKYAEYMNKNYPLPGGKKWGGCIVTYEHGDAVALFGL